MTTSGAQYPITAGVHTATVVEVGAGLRHFSRDGVDVTCGYAEDAMAPKACGITLAPWPNRIRGGRYTFDGTEQQLALSEPKYGNASHGLGRWTRWALVAHDPDAVTLRLDVVPQNGYPFEVRTDVTYRLDPATGLTVTVQATNLGGVRAPFGTGNHPYLSGHGHPIADVRVRLAAATRLVTDDAQIPVDRVAVAGTDHDLADGAPLGARRLDDCYADIDRADDGAGGVEVRSPTAGARLWFDAGYCYAQVFTVEDLGGAGAAVAVEPMTCPADAFNSGDGLLVLEPGGSWTGRWGIEAL